MGARRTSANLNALKLWGIHAADCAGDAVNGSQTLTDALRRFPFPDLSDDVGEAWSAAVAAAETAKHAAMDADRKLHLLLGAEWNALGGE